METFRLNLLAGFATFFKKFKSFLSLIENFAVTGKMRERGFEPPDPLRDRIS